MGELAPDSPFFFLPPWPPSGSAVLWVSLTIVLAGLIGEIAWRRFNLPRVVGYALVGTGIASLGLGIAGSGLNPSLRLIVDLALALLLFEMGCRIDLSWLRRNPWLLATSLAEALLTFVAVRTALVWVGMDPQSATPAAAIAIATSPAVVMRVASEFKASGQVTERLIMLSGLNTLYAALATKFVLGWLHAEYSGNLLVALLHPGYLLFGSAIVAAMLAAAVAVISRKLDLQNENSTLLLIGLILLALAITRTANLSTLIVPLLAGMILRNASPRPWIWPRHFGTAGGALVQASTSPRLTSISSSSVRVTDCPATARSRSPSRVTMRATRLSRPDVSTFTFSPGLTVPPTMVPAKPRKSRFGRLTHCTGSRNGWCCTLSSISTVSR
jgi:hypothetical protein